MHATRVNFFILIGMSESVERGKECEAADRVWLGSAWTNNVSNTIYFGRHPASLKICNGTRNQMIQGRKHDPVLGTFYYDYKCVYLLFYMTETLHIYVIITEKF